MQKVYVVIEEGCTFQYNEHGDYFENVIAVCDDESIAIEYIKAGYEKLMNIYHKLYDDFIDNEYVALTEPYYRESNKYVTGDSEDGYLAYKYEEFEISKEVKLP